MTERTALEIALDLDAASCSSFAKLEAAESLRRQHAEIERLREMLAGDHEEPWAENRKLRRYVGNNMLRSDFRNVDEMRAEIERLRAQVKRLRDALVGMVEDDEVNGLRFTAAVLGSMDCDDATVLLAAVRVLIDIRPEGSAGEGKR